MKQSKGLWIITFAVLMAAVLTFGACNITIGDTEWNYDANGTKEGTLEIFDKFFKDTYAQEKLIVSQSSGNQANFIETIEGDKDHVDSTGMESWTFIQNDQYVYAWHDKEDGTKVYYVNNKEYYDLNHLVYKDSLLEGIEIFKNLPDESNGGTWSCHAEGKGTFDEDGKKNTGTGTLTLKVKYDNGSITIEATFKDGLVDSMTLTKVENGQTKTFNYAFVYGTASVTLPDITGSDWYNGSAEDSDEDNADDNGADE